MATRRARPEADPIRITTAPQSRHADMARRRKRYAVSMSIRTLCFLGAVIVQVTWLRWVLIAGALILPYIAVVMANTANPRIPGADLVAPTGGHKELG